MSENMVVALLDRAEGNSEVGTSWIDTGVFSPETPLKEVIAWAQRQTSAYDGYVRANLSIRYADDQRHQKQSS